MTPQNTVRTTIDSLVGDAVEWLSSQLAEIRVEITEEDKLSLARHISHHLGVSVRFYSPITGTDRQAPTQLVGAPTQLVGVPQNAARN